MMMTQTQGWLIRVGLSVVISLFFVIPIKANGAPITIFLNYLPEISNYGPTEISGEAELSIGEAWVDIKVSDMPPLEGDLYQAWLIPTEGNQMISLGTFNADPNGTVAYYAEFDDIPDIDYEMVVISVEPDPDPDPAADSRRSIAGFFPNLELQVVAGTPTATLEPGVTPTPGAPKTLPVTGSTNFELIIFLVGLLSLLLGLTGLSFIKFQRQEKS